MRTQFARCQVLCGLAVLMLALAARADEGDDDSNIDNAGESDGAQWRLSPGSGPADDSGDDWGDKGRWFTAWSNSISVRLKSSSTAPNYAPDVTNSTVRVLVRPTIAGNALRIKLENTLGKSPVVLSAAFVGQAGTGAAIAPGTNRPLTFQGQPGITLQPGEGAYSDPLPFPVKPFQRLAVSLNVVSAAEVSAHSLGLATTYISPGPVGSSESDAGFAPVNQDAGTFPIYWVAAVDVKSGTAAGTIVTFGDSITDGRCSTRDPATGVIYPDQYNRWTDLLAARLQARYGKRAPAIANEGIAGNRVAAPTGPTNYAGTGPAALDRLDNDVLGRAGLRWVVFFEGTNDIFGGSGAATLIAAIQQVIDRVHAKGVPIIGSPIIPRGKTTSAPGWSPAMEAVRLQVNHWIRTQANFDGMIEFPALMQGPIDAASASETIWRDYSCFDNTHPNKAGYQAMGSYVDLGLFKIEQDW
jgi:lysophospholipase L1-like esterase